MINIKSLFKDNDSVTSTSYINDDICRISVDYISQFNNNATTITKIHIYQYALIDLPLIGNNNNKEENSSSKLCIQLHPMTIGCNNNGGYNSILPSWILNNIIKEDDDKDDYLFYNQTMDINLLPIPMLSSASTSSNIIIEIDHIKDEHSSSLYNIDQLSNRLSKPSSLSTIRRYLIDKPIIKNVMYRLKIMGTPYLIKIVKILKKQRKGDQCYEITDDEQLDNHQPIYFNCSSSVVVRMKSNTSEEQDRENDKRKKSMFDKVVHLNQEIKEFNSILTIKFGQDKDNDNDDVIKKKNTLTKVIRDSIKGIMVIGEQGTQTLELIQYVCNYPESLSAFKIVYMDNSYIEKSQQQQQHDTSINTIFIFNGLDIAFPKGESSEDGQRQSPKLLKLCSFIDSLQPNQLFVCSSRSIDSVNQSLLRASRIDRFIKIAIPSQQQRFIILKSMLSNSPINNNSINNNNNNINENNTDQLNQLCQQLSMITPGFIYRDLYKLCSTTILSKISNNNNDNSILTLEDFIIVKDTISPSTMSHFDVQQLGNNVGNIWESVGGYQEIKQRLIEMIEWPLIHSKTFSRLSLQPSSGVLLYGPSGCGKTLLVKAAASKMNVNFISIKGSDIFSKWLGESERIIREIFARARLSSPCILFFDEIDSICLSRSNMDNSEGGSNVQSRILSQLLNEMDGIQIKSQIFLMGCTTRLDLLDAALLRPGRFEAQLYVGLPDESDRRDMIGRVFSSRMTFDPNLDIDKLVQLTDGYNGAQIQYLCNEAGLKALQSDINSQFITNHHFDQVESIFNGYKKQQQLSDESEDEA